MTGTDLRINADYFPIASSIIEVNWAPKTGTFTMNDATIDIGKSSAKMSGVFVLGLDDLYGPTVGISMTGHDVVIAPGDPDVPAGGFDSISFKGWSAPIYGALGIDEAVMIRGERRGSRARAASTCSKRASVSTWPLPGRASPPTTSSGSGRIFWPPTPAAWFVQIGDGDDRERQHEIRVPGRHT